ncbi:hypothetical protein ISP15_06735 [Dyella jejuensis]|uniref:Uncharacterized protein n=1 Tax=Dyella jejuensis TaxID=1432009 RepID=A0ABW8JG03_9GAMM
MKHKLLMAVLVSVLAGCATQPTGIRGDQATKFREQGVSISSVHGASAVVLQTKGRAIGAFTLGSGGGYGAGGSTVGNALSGIGTTLSLTTSQRGNSSSDTNSGIAQGAINVRDNPNRDLSDLDRDRSLGNQALAPIFDAQKVQENMELSQVAGYVGMRAAARRRRWTGLSTTI